MEDAAADLRFRLARANARRAALPPPPESKKKAKRRARAAVYAQGIERYVWVMVNGKNELKGPFTIEEAAAWTS